MVIQHLALPESDGFTDATVTNNLRIWNKPGTGVTVNSGGVLNTGSITMVGGVLNLQGGMLNGGSANIQGGLLSVSAGTISNSTNLILSGGEIAGVIVNNGTFTYNSGTFSGRLRNFATITLNANVTFGDGWENPIAFALPAGPTITTNGAGFLNTGTLSMTGGTLTGTTQLTNSNLIQGYGRVDGAGTLTNNSGATINAKSGNLVIATNGFTNDGTIANATGASLYVESSAVTNTGGITVNPGGSVVFDAPISNLSGKTLAIVGGTFGTPTLTNASGGSVSGFGTVSANVNNSGSMQFYGPTNIVGNLSNQAGGTVTITNNQLLVTGPSVNNGTIKTNHGTAIFQGGLTNNGVYNSDPADNYFTDLITTDSGYLLGGAGDNFYVTGDFLSTSSQSAAWNTSAARLRFSGNTAHQMGVTGEDLGPALAGYNNNMAWGIVEIGAGGAFTLQDGNLSPGGALYVGSFILDDGVSQISSITSNGIDIYYDPTAPGNAYLNDETYPISGGGFISPIPEPHAGLFLGVILAGTAVARRRRLVSPFAPPKRSSK